jgi:hypothetical protein
MERKDDQSAKNEEEIKKIRTFPKHDFLKFATLIIKRRGCFFGNGGLLACRELDEASGLFNTASNVRSDKRTWSNIQHKIKH